MLLPKLNLKKIYVKSKSINHAPKTNKRPFIVQRIIKDIYGKNYVDNSKDPLLMKKKNLKKKTEKEGTDKSIIDNNNNNSLNNKIKRILKRKKSDSDLPTIYRSRLRNINLLRYPNYYNRGKLIESELMDSKIYNTNIPRKLGIYSFMNKLPGNQSLIENYKSIKDINIINDKYNLNLNLKPKEFDSKIFKGKKYTIFGMLHKLFAYYSSPESINKSSNESIEKEKDNDLQLYNNDTNTFLTKLNIYSNGNSSLSTQKENDYFDINKLLQRKYSYGKENKNNENIINNDKKIFIDCLLSKMNSLNIRKILYKYIDKTIYGIAKEPFYRRYKTFEKRIKKILKKS